MWQFLFFLYYIPVVSLRFNDRNGTHLLFEYIFSQNQCHEGIFEPIEYINGTSFGNLIVGEALTCLDRSGYKSHPIGNQIAFHSNKTISSLLQCIQQTQQLSIEFWIQNYEGNNYIAKMASIQPDNVTSETDCVLNFLMLTEYWIVLLHSTSKVAPSLEYYQTEEAPVYAHVVINLQFLSNTTLATSFINGTQFTTDTFKSINITTWNSNALFYGSRKRYDSTNPIGWLGEVYHFAFYDHILSEDHILHNYQCSYPPSIPSLLTNTIHCNMNRITNFTLLLYDHNINTNTNLFDGYASYVKLLLLPSKGILYSSLMQPITELPETGLTLSNFTFYYEPPFNDYSTTIYTNISFVLSNPYGTSSIKTIPIFVDWVNSAPIVTNQSYTMLSHQHLSVVLNVTDYDNNQNYTRILSITPNCRILTPIQNSILYAFEFKVDYIYNIGLTSFSDYCDIVYCVGDTYNDESIPATIHIDIYNDLLLNTDVFDVNENETSLIQLQFDEQTDRNDIFIHILSLQPSVGTFEGNTTLLSYYADSTYFSSPKVDIYGHDLDNDDVIVTFYTIYKGLRSNEQNFTLIIHNNNTAPIISSLLSYQFNVYTPIAIPIVVYDDDRDTQNCKLTVTTTAGFFTISLASSNHSLIWIDGNYGEGMDDNKLIAEGSLSAINASLQTITYRAIYRLNDTMVICIDDGEYHVEQRIFLHYVVEETKPISINFWVIISLLCVGLLLWIITLCLKCCGCCNCKEKRKMKKVMKMVLKEEEKRKQKEEGFKEEKKKKEKKEKKEKKQQQQQHTSSNNNPISKPSTKPTHLNNSDISSNHPSLSSTSIVNITSSRVIPPHLPESIKRASKSNIHKEESTSLPKKKIQPSSPSSIPHTGSKPISTIEIECNNTDYSICAPTKRAPPPPPASLPPPLLLHHSNK